MSAVGNGRTCSALLRRIDRTTRSRCRPPQPAFRTARGPLPTLLATLSRLREREDAEAILMLNPFG